VGGIFTRTHTRLADMCTSLLEECNAALRALSQSSQAHRLAEAKAFVSSGLESSKI